MRAISIRFFKAIGYPNEEKVICFEWKGVENLSSNGRNNRIDPVGWTLDGRSHRTAQPLSLR